MKKTDLSAMTIAELKALAKEKHLPLPAGTRKVDIVAALMGDLHENAKEPLARKNGSLKKFVARKSLKTGDVSVQKQPCAGQKSSGGKKPSAISPVREWRVPPRAEEPHMVQERVSDSKYYTGPAPSLTVASHGELQNSYGEEKITLMSRDPFVAYAYWEVSSARIEREKTWFGWDAKLCIRIYDITGVQFDGRNAIGYYDQEISDQVGNWYFDFGRPSHSFCAELGLLAPGGRFLTMVKSNYITMPRDGVSSAVDDEWMLLDEEFMRLYGIPSGMSSPQIQEMMKRRRLQEITSPGMFSRERARRK